jgi:hypothetical protein
MIPIKAKKLLKKAIPSTTSEKRERISNWWTDVCNKASERKKEKCRTQMHKDLQVQLKNMRKEQRDEMSLKSNHSPASANVANININTASTSVTHVDLDSPNRINYAAFEETTRKRTRKLSSLGKSFFNFRKQTRRKQAYAFNIFEKNKQKKLQEQLDQERKRSEARSRLLSQQKRLEGFIQLIKK